MKLNILIIDDHFIFREGVKEVISERIEDTIFGELTNDTGLLDKLKSAAWDVVILDLNIPGRSGLEVLKDIKTEYPDLPIIILSMYSEAQFAVRVIKAGASGYLTKGVSPTELVKAINTAAEGNVYFTEEVAKLVAKGLKRTDKPPLEILTDREIQIMIMLASGKRLTEIGNELNLSVKTIGTHRQRILEKLALKNNIEISRFALDESLIFY